VALVQDNVLPNFSQRVRITFNKVIGFRLAIATSLFFVNPNEFPRRPLWAIQSECAILISFARLFRA